MKRVDVFKVRIEELKGKRKQYWVCVLLGVRDENRKRMVDVERIDGISWGWEIGEERMFYGIMEIKKRGRIVITPIKKGRYWELKLPQLRDEFETYDYLIVERGGVVLKKWKREKSIDEHLGRYLALAERIGEIERAKSHLRRALVGMDDDRLKAKVRKKMSEFGKENK